MSELRAHTHSHSTDSRGRREGSGGEDVSLYVDACVTEMDQSSSGIAEEERGVIQMGTHDDGGGILENVLSKGGYLFYICKK